MFRFFNNIRQNLIVENRYRKYLLYSIGEIILVVIGILIAVQINNWNETKKERANEWYLLTEMESNLLEEQPQLNEMIERRIKAQDAIKKLIIYVPNLEINLDSLEADAGKIFTFERYFPIRNSYEILKSNGLQITNKNLRSLIVKYYEFDQNKVQRSVLDIEQSFQTKFTPILGSTRIKEAKYGEYIRFNDPNDKELVDEIYAAVFGFRNNHADSMKKILAFKDINAELLEAVQNELGYQK